MTAGRDLGRLPFCYLTTVGRVTGRPHRIEIWFALHDTTIYLLAGGGDRADWVRNLVVAPEVVVELGDRSMSTRARVVLAGTEEDGVARRLLVEKYQPGYGGDLSEWGRTALPVAIDWR